MTATVPTKADVEALHQFLQDRNDEEWRQAQADQDLSDARFEAVRRLTNSHKLALAGTTSYLLATLDRDNAAQAEQLWHYLTSCGEEWRDHPQWRSKWRNPARAALLGERP